MRDAFYYDLEKRVNALAKQADHNTAVFINDLQVIKCKLDAIENYLSVGGWRLFIRTIINFILRDDPANDLQINFQKELKKLNEARTRALIGKYAGDVAEVQAPGGIRSFEILGVRYV